MQSARLLLGTPDQGIRVTVALQIHTPHTPPPPPQYFNSMESKDIKKCHSIKISFTRDYSDLHEGFWGEEELRMVYKLISSA